MNDFELGKKLHEQLERVKAYLLKMGASLQDAEDITQETAYKFLTYIDSVNIENVERWLFRVSVNQYYDLCRKRNRQKNISLKFNYKELFEEFTPEKAVLQKELEKDIYILLDRLKPKYAQFLILKYSIGLKLTEIAALYDMKVDSVKTIIHRARKQFIEEYRRHQNERRE
ncbi:MULTISPECIES: RNA polymerase sigma factor [Parageobacillus]|jgi:RNA polymerase sigma factor (sigma-70 family)|uniref:RNA polymerase subunit sigma-70 n=1 Tax=Parageobacillus thermoglucosidasius TaxID=1426 RepID=A0A1B7KV79_PARTM|nr:MULTISPECIES: RNA polymerase sigma factor [Parageobacillus]OAT73998.1 RNA polymerase subunit sigma-70 [Parageobacillus thermoglucosidasius]BDG47338.1 DNA-directed RNA polymerase sigma-70 factor [Parageobacillus sp. KH3-4]